MTFPLIDWIFAENLLLRAFAGTFRSCMIAIALLIIGAPLSFWVSRLMGQGRLTGPMAIIFGFSVLSLLSWYAFNLAINVRIVYVILIASGIGISLVSIAQLVINGAQREKVYGLGRLVLGDIAIFFASVLAYSLLSFAKIEPSTLPLLSSGNNDLLAYLKCGQSLFFLPHANPVGGGWEVLRLIKTDAFGAFNLIALASFILHADVEKCAIPVLGFAIGLIALGIGTICQRIFKLPLFISILISILFTTSPLFSYLILNYFLAQILFQGVLLAAVFYLAEMANGRPGETRFTIYVLLGSSLTVLFVYYPWFLQFIAITSAGIGAAFLFQRGSLRPAVVAKAASLSLAVFVALHLGDLVIGTSRYFIAIGRLRDSISIAAGWPLPFVNLNLLIGIPDVWSEAPNVGVPVWGQVIPPLLILALSTVILIQSDKALDNKGRSFMLLCLAVSILLYFVAWNLYGVSYRQWKFATTLSLPLGFAVIASLCYLLLLRRGRVVVHALVFLAIGIGIHENVSQYFNKWSGPVFPFSAELSKLAASDADNGVNAVYIDVPGFSQRMAAALFVKNKPILFGGQTYFNKEGAPQLLPDGMIAVLHENCIGESRIPEYTVNNLPSNKALIPVHQVGDKVPLSKDSCLKLEGFSGGEPLGRWTDGKIASIEVRCVCDVSDNRKQIILHAGAYIVPGIAEHQRVIFRVNGSAPQERKLVSTEKVDIVLDVPADASDPNLVSIKIDLPDATSPVAAGLPDTRTLGLFIANLTIKQS